MVLYELQDRQSVEWDGRNFVSSKAGKLFQNERPWFSYGSTAELWWMD